MENIPFEPLVDHSKPLHPWYGETEQFRLKVQRYSDCPFEFTVQKISFQKDLERYQKAALYSRTVEASVSPRSRSPRSRPEDRDEESIERSQRRSKSQVRRAVLELAPNHFTTFTTRETGPDYLTIDKWRDMWSYFVTLVRTANLEFEYVAVPERHPSNPSHFHVHVAWRGNAHYGLLRKFWHIAIGHATGRDIRKIQYGSESPGNIQDKPVKAPRGSFKQVRKIARYIAKYITKDLISEFNKKRYWISKGVNVRDAQVFWLESLSQAEAVREACSMLGQWDEESGVCPQNYFRPSDRVFWCAIDPALTPPPPF